MQTYTTERMAGLRDANAAAESTMASHERATAVNTGIIARRSKVKALLVALYRDLVRSAPGESPRLCSEVNQNRESRLSAMQISQRAESACASRESTTDSDESVSNSE